MRSGRKYTPVVDPRRQCVKRRHLLVCAFYYPAWELFQFRNRAAWVTISIFVFSSMLHRSADNPSGLLHQDCNVTRKSDIFVRFFARRKILGPQPAKMRTQGVTHAKI